MNDTSATRTRTRPLRALDPSRRLLNPGQLITSPETGLPYRIERLLGAGGFGQVYLAERARFARLVPPTVCIKASEHIDGWLREAYFGQLLDGHPRAIRLYDTFPLMRDNGRVLYCLAIEYARHGDLRAYLKRTGKGWRGGGRPARDRGRPRGAGQAPSRPDAAPGPHAAERVRVRGPEPQARRLRDRPPAERRPRHHRAHAQRADRARRDPGRRRRPSGRPATTCTRSASSWAC